MKPLTKMTEYEKRIDAIKQRSATHPAVIELREFKEALAQAYADDMEQGVAWLTEQHIKDFSSEHPNIDAFLARLDESE